MLDTYFKEKELPVSCIKADIEGAEMDMLMGAKELIKKYHPRMAISIYHRQEDLFILPYTINKLVPEYKMEIRQHRPHFGETVLYCYL